MPIKRVANIGLTLTFAAMATILPLLGDELLGPNWYRFFYYHPMSGYMLLVCLYTVIVVSWFMTGWCAATTIKGWNKTA